MRQVSKSRVLAYKLWFRQSVTMTLNPNAFIVDYHYDKQKIRAVINMHEKLPSLGDQ